MMGRMNKRINTLSMRTMLGIERKEHGLKKTPTLEQAAKIEMAEHGLKRKPTAAKMMQAEAVEHYPGMGSLSIKGTRKSEAQASAIYKRGR